MSKSFERRGGSNRQKSYNSNKISGLSSWQLKIKPNKQVGNVDCFPKEPR